MKEQLTIYHGSHEIISNPTCGLGKPYNDYGRGFYCTESLDLAKEWACDEKAGGFANKYLLNTSGLKILSLNSKQFNIIHWISVLLKNRKFTIDNDIAATAYEYILKNFPVDTDSYDVITGYRADDSYFSYARDFLNNTITVKKLSEAMKLGKLGNQIVLKSPLAFNRIEFLGYEVAPQDVHFPLRKNRDELARISYLSSRNKNPFDSNSLFIADIIRGGIKADDPRLQ